MPGQELGVPGRLFLDPGGFLLRHPGQGAEFLSQDVGEGPALALVARSALPDAVHPEVLLGRGTDHGLDRAPVARRQIEERVGLGLPLLDASARSTSDSVMPPTAQCNIFTLISGVESCSNAFLSTSIEPL